MDVEHWQDVARFIRDMDPRTAWFRDAGSRSGFVGRQFDQFEGAKWDAISAVAAGILHYAASLEEKTPTPEQTMVERVARAICKDQFSDAAFYGDEICCQFAPASQRPSDEFPCCYDGFEDAARAAIEAMREPLDQTKGYESDDAP